MESKNKQTLFIYKNLKNMVYGDMIGEYGAVEFL